MDEKSLEDQLKVANFWRERHCNDNVLLQKQNHRLFLEKKEAEEDRAGYICEFEEIHKALDQAHIARDDEFKDFLYIRVDTVIAENRINKLTIACQEAAIEEYKARVLALEEAILSSIKQMEESSKKWYALYGEKELPDNMKDTYAFRGESMKCCADLFELLIKDKLKEYNIEMPNKV